MKLAIPVLAAAVVVTAAPTKVQASPRVLSLDQCADQFVMALAPRESIVGVSHRADDPDSWLRAQARGLPVRRVSFETVWATRPDVVVRYWGGDPRLLAALSRRGVQVVTIEEAVDFGGVRANVELVSAALGRAPQGRRLVAAMEGDLTAASGAWGGRSALYLTPGAFTAGSGTLIDSVLRAAGMANAESAPGFRPAPLEQLILTPPAAVVRGFWDTARFTRWQLGGHGALARLLRRRTFADLPASTLGCPGPMAATAARLLAAPAPRPDAPPPGEPSAKRTEGAHLPAPRP